MQGMVFLLTQGSQWPAAIVAISILLIIALLMIVTLLKHEFDDALKLLGALGSLIGLITGMAGTYFFTREQVVLAEQQASLAQSQLGQLNTQVAELRADNQSLAQQAMEESQQMNQILRENAILTRQLDLFRKDPLKDLPRFAFPFDPGRHEEFEDPNEQNRMPS